MNAMEITNSSDANLVAASLAGHRDAFGQIVARYQSLICSVAYSKTGNLGQSEDLAQEVFLAAWKQLASLKDPNKLRSWLCGIARNLIHDALRKQGREPSHAAEPLDSLYDSPAPGPQPHHSTISNEEATILWRSLERIPENYREPLILFYREHQSVEAVAEMLELTEDNVKQRLSRGRKLLQEQVLAFVEGALERTSPGQAFTLAVLAALPISLATSAKAATTAMAAAKGGAMAKGVTIGSVFGVLLGPALGVFCGYLGVRSSLKSACTPRERAFILRYAKRTVAAALIFTATLLLFDYLFLPFWKGHAALVIATGLGITLVWCVYIFFATWRFGRAFMLIRTEERELHPESFRNETNQGCGWGFGCTPWEYRSRTTLFGVPLVHCRRGKLPGERYKPAVGWIAFGEVACGILFASGGFAVGGISMGGACVGIISIGGLGVGLLAFGGMALGGVALGGAAIGVIASGGIALGWHAALGGIAAAHRLALGGAAIAPHANDALARDFFTRYRWLDFTQPGPRNLFWALCFGPMVLQMLIWNRWRGRTAKRATQK